MARKLLGTSPQTPHSPHVQAGRPPFVYGHTLFRSWALYPRVCACPFPGPKQRPPKKGFGHTLFWTWALAMFFDAVGPMFATLWAIVATLWAIVVTLWAIVATLWAIVASSLGRGPRMPNRIRGPSLKQGMQENKGGPEIRRTQRRSVLASELGSSRRCKW